MTETANPASPALMRPAIEEVLAQADAIDAAWAEIIRETGDHPPIKAWEADDDARRDLAAAAVAVLRDLMTRVDDGLPVLLAGPRPPDPELIVMVCSELDGDDEEEYVVEYPSPYGRQYDEAVFLQIGDVFTVCPHCERVNGGVIEVDRAVRWNTGLLGDPQPESHQIRLADGSWVTQPNPLAGVPTIDIAQQTRGDAETDYFMCGACETAIELPDFIEVNWS